ncbi:MAG TPA: hypothetical protein VFX86_01975 [Candidatus Saccharimonadales bacterium]|nr:hypothetical protein [Candidatus Saccharimonadales bacterium]
MPITVATQAGGVPALQEAGFEFSGQGPRISEGSSIDGIVAVERLYENVQSGHHRRLDRYIMGDGNVYETELTRAADERSDTAIADSTPWIVGRKGFNEKVNGQFNEMGYSTISVSPVGSALGASLRHSAHNMNSIVGHVLQNSDLRPAVLGYGSSRAAAIALGLRGMEYADVIAPCFPRAPRAEELLGTVAQAGFEAIELGKHVLRIGPGGVARQRKTFSTSPSDWLHYLEVVPHLWSGDAGRLAWSNRHTPTHITLFDKDGWSQPDDWKAMAEDRPNTAITMLEGRHMRIPDPRVLAGPFHRFDVLAEMRGYDGSFESVDFDSLAEAQPPEPDRRSGPLGNISLGNIIKAGFRFAA